MSRPAPEASPRRPTTRWAGRLLSLVVLVVLAYLGGSAATWLWPVQTQTRYLSARVSVGPTLDRTVRLPTVLGDLLIGFDGQLPAPALSAQVQVRDEVTRLIRSGHLRSAELRPSRTELREAIDVGVREAAWKFAAGALATSGLVAGAYTLARRRGGAAAVVAAGSAWALVVTAAGASAYRTYRTDNVASFQATSLLSAVQESSGMLDDLTARADHGAVYVTNLLALSDALRQEFDAEPGARETAVTLLLVSDIHGMDEYPLMREIVRSRGVDAVVDTGDLINFGQPREGELTHLYAGIESLGVPYLFIRGNHDATSATDEALLRRLASIPNVVLLEPSRGRFQQASVGGVTVSGFNDARFYNDPAGDKAAAQAELAQAWAERTRGLTPTDLVLVHEPYAAHRVQAGQLTVNGHMHVPALEPGHLQVGSFTGGGLVNQFRIPPLTERAQQDAQEDPTTAGELVGNPSGFDLLRFGGDCRLLSLTRYSYRNLVQGRPSFDDVSIVNGRAVTDAAPEGRTCAADVGLQVSPLPPASGS